MRRSLSSVGSALIAAGVGAASALFGVCGPFTDVSDPSFCPFVLEIFTLGITTGTTATTYDPAATVSRLQMAAFLSRTVDRALQRGSARTPMSRFWKPQSPAALGLTTLAPAAGPVLVRSDGEDVWSVNNGNGTVSRVRGGDGRLLETWTGAGSAVDAVRAMGRIIVLGATSPGRLYQIDPRFLSGVVTTVASTLVNAPSAIEFDGSKVWVANGSGASVSIVNPKALLTWTLATVTTGFAGPQGILYDGSNIWVTDTAAGTLLKLDSLAVILQTVTVGSSPLSPTFDGANIWVANQGSSSVSVVRASTGAVLATLTGNGLNQPRATAFDGQRVLVTSSGNAGVSLWKAADLTPIGSFTTGVSTAPRGACSDGAQFWIALNGSNQLARF